jgi:hypothetical protein
VTTRDSFPVTTIARTLLDLAPAVTRRALERMIDRAARDESLDLDAIDAILAAYPKRQGRRKLVAILADHRPGSTHTRSGLEELMLALCRAHGVPQPELNVPIGPYTADFLWRDRKLIVETDDPSTHATIEAFEHDRRRDAYLTVRGFRVVRYTRKRLMSEPRRVAGEIRALLAR